MQWFVGMLSGLRREWHKFESAPPGERFEQHYRRTHDVPRGKMHAMLHWVGALVAVAIGLVLTVFPGPAILFFLIAAAMLSTQALWLARLLDRGEVRLRAWGRVFLRWWRRRALWQKAALGTGALAISGAVIVFSLWLVIF